MNEKNITIQYDTLGSESCLSIDISTDVQVIDYEVNMIKNNVSLGFLNLDIKQIDNDKKIIFYYDSKMSLTDYLINENYTIDDLFEIIKSILIAIESCNEFMMDSRKIVLNTDNIFIDKENLMIYLMYIPIVFNSECNVDMQFTDLCKVLLKDVKEFKNELLKSERKLFNILYSKNFSIKDVKEAFKRYYESEQCKEDVESNEQITELPTVTAEDQIQYKSIIEENYSDFEYFSDDELEEDDEDILFKEFEDIMEYDKNKDNRKVKILLSVQIFTTIVISCIAIKYSIDSIKMFLILSALILGLLWLLIHVITFDKEKNYLKIDEDWE